MNKKNTKSILKTEAKVIAYVIICLTVIVIGISYSLYSDVKHNTTNQVVKAGTLIFNFEHGNQITNTTGEECFNQTNDADAQSLTKCVYTVTVKNTGTLPGKYSLTLKQSTSTNPIDLSKLKVVLKKNNTMESGFPKAVTNTTGNLTNNAILNAKETATYTIQVYADDSKVTEQDNDKDISLEIEGIAEVNSASINP